MKHKTLEASTTTAELGQFSAIAAAYSVDRVGDRIIPGAFEKTINAWNQSGKRIPLHWDHESSAESIIGYVDPASMKETDQGLYVEGQLDLEHSEVAREAWRSMKNNAVALSFGYLAEETKAADGVNDLTSIDLFEVSVVPGPANPDTRFLSLKAMPMGDRQDMASRMRDMADMMAQDPMPMSEAEMAQRMRAMADEMAASSKAVWSAAYINDLPDSCFLYIESGGTKDSEGKTTPRSLRHFPVKDASGNIDMPHLRNALSRIPQSNLPQSVKDRATAKAQRMMDSMKSLANEGDEEPKEAKPSSEEPSKVKSAPDDSLHRESMEKVIKTATEGFPTQRPQPEPEPVRPSLSELERDSYEAVLKMADF